MQIVPVRNGNMAMEEETIHGWSMTSVIYNSDQKSLGIQNQIAWKFGVYVTNYGETQERESDLLLRNYTKFTSVT